MTEESENRSQETDLESLTNQQQQPANSASPGIPVVAWEEIAAGKRQIFIRFRNQTYQLRETRNGKLIMTK